MQTVLGIAVVLLAGCTSSSPDLIRREDAQRLSSVEDAVVLFLREVKVESGQTGVGAAAGGVVGGIAGYGSGGNQRDGQIMGVLAAVAGAAAGNAIERISNREDAYEIVVQLKSGERRAVVQAKGAEVFAPGDAVLLITSGGKVRIARAPAVAPVAKP
jgi:outer membrane lipoprotein SlyB